MPKTARPLINKEMQCLDCKTTQTIQRIKGRDRKQGHIKTLWCCACRERILHKELGWETPKEEIPKEKSYPLSPWELTHQWGHSGDPC